MIYGYSPWVVAGVAVLAGAAVVGVVVTVVNYLGDGDEDDLAEFREPDGTLPDEVELAPPTLRGSSFGAIGELLKTWRYLRKAERLAGKGYVKWYCIDDTFPAPRFVKPEDKGTGEREYEHDGGIYLFPDDGRKPDAHTGMWTYIHQKGDPEPLNLTDYRETVMTSEQMDEWATQAVTAERPSSGLLDGLAGLTPQQMMMGAVGASILVAVVFSQLGGA